MGKRVKNFALFQNWSIASIFIETSKDNVDSTWWGYRIIMIEERRNSKTQGKPGEDT